MSDVILVYPEREGKKRRREREKKEAVPISFCVYFSKVTQTPAELRIDLRPHGNRHAEDAGLKGRTNTGLSAAVHG